MTTKVKLGYFGLYNSNLSVYDVYLFCNAENQNTVKQMNHYVDMYNDDKITATEFREKIKELKDQLK